MGGQVTKLLEQRDDESVSGEAFVAASLEMHVFIQWGVREARCNCFLSSQAWAALAPAAPTHAHPCVEAMLKACPPPPRGVRASWGGHPPPQQQQQSQ